MMMVMRKTIRWVMVNMGMVAGKHFEGGEVRSVIIIVKIFIL